jgi:hypothetical protein
MFGKTSEGKEFPAFQVKDMGIYQKSAYISKLFIIS